jgi:para-nitrobenzyl esterase
MVWIHGGGFFTGGTNDSWYDGTIFAERGDVVLVSIQYRLGALGWLYLDELGGKEFSNSKNNGLLDQVAALRKTLAGIRIILRSLANPLAVPVYVC